MDTVRHVDQIRSEFELERQALSNFLLTATDDVSAIGQTTEQPRDSLPLDTGSLTDQIHLAQGAFPLPLGPRYTISNGLCYYERTRLYIPNDKALQLNLL